MAKKYNQLGLIGCGLMGGSLALALKKEGLVKKVVGYSKSPTTTTLARQLGVIDTEASSAIQACAGADLIVLAVPVAASGEMFKTIRQFVHPHVLTMDVGSTKSDVVLAAEKHLGWGAQYFVPAHPITGKERSGVDHADAMLYYGAKVVLTPTPATDLDHVQRAQELWTALGSDVRIMSPQEHDAALAAVSHLPHLLAFAYVNSLLGQPHSDSLLRLAGPGFRDFTRIAASDSALWRDVLLANRTEITGQLRHMVLAIQEFQRALHSEDAEALEQLIQKASQARNDWRKHSA
ncbi:prephenate dehydrogenase/arogenate dehydrogenase family protein [Allofranklinella schreckenbergeri]|uniref:Prephenate dehydrogenase/arogenate dehydrogenase family protein n=1 Tax=Allofranklinella schreckenbergeri TaxID=1076744 RepID=A0A3M6R5C9_9BURK|nr:prephenate dehydrogenase/arogenate dehydrogenase family protein [Allofranklinella schreckenbergeri]MDO4706570.1 prephenate dehydrogenase/arogenate dehydrogenase family protein [Comamonadaceae bacterium]RMX10562.1 prephenate dehydrogenase/arogenate dehydrogenase family protein [Allofranklinella schreckenbergeri]